METGDEDRNGRQHKGCLFLENPNPDFRIQKKGYESLKLILWVDCSDQIQIRIVENHHLSVFMGKELKKVFLTSSFRTKLGGHKHKIIDRPFN